MPRSGPRTVRRYSDEFKLTAVRLSRQPEMQVKTVAGALEIHPFMLSKWRKDARDGTLRGKCGARQRARCTPSQRSERRVQG
jgi:transposase-like protein